MWFFLFVVYVCIACCIFFFFKQKTAYEMRISDWSSDVCSSDLGADRRVAVARGRQLQWRLARLLPVAVGSHLVRASLAVHRRHHLAADGDAATPADRKSVV